MTTLPSSTPRSSGRPERRRGHRRRPRARPPRGSARHQRLWVTEHHNTPAWPWHPCAAHRAPGRPYRRIGSLRRRHAAQATPLTVARSSPCSRPSTPAASTWSGPGGQGPTRRPRAAPCDASEFPSQVAELMTFLGLRNGPRASVRPDPVVPRPEVGPRFWVLGSTLRSPARAAAGLPSPSPSLRWRRCRNRLPGLRENFRPRGSMPPAP